MRTTRRITPRLALALFGALVLSGCAGEPDAIDVAYGGECVVELEFVPTATQRDVDAFVRRVERIEHVQRLQVLSRAANIARYRDGLRRAGHAGESFDRLMARAHRGAGRVLLVKADADRQVPAVMLGLRTLPATVTSMAERDSCHSAS